MINPPTTQSEGCSTSGELVQPVSLKLDSEEYGIEALKVREIIRTRATKEIGEIIKVSQEETMNAVAGSEGSTNGN